MVNLQFMYHLVSILFGTSVAFERSDAKRVYLLSAAMVEAIGKRGLGGG
jgi:hypothetical protein